MTSPDAPAMLKTWLDHPRAPRLVLPPLACDCHVHLFGPVERFPYAPGLRTLPAPAPKEALFELHRRMGIARCVIVQSVTHGMDNRVVEEAMAVAGGRCLGVALVPADVPQPELRRLASAGFRAVRFHFMRHIAGGPDVDQVLALTPRLAEAGMHLQVHFESELVHTVGQALRRSAVPVVIDHMARVDARRGTDHEDFQALLRLLGHPGMHVKLSGIDRAESGARAGSGYPLGVALARRLMADFPERCVWGLDWPHPNHTHVPDDGELVDALAHIAPTPELLARLLVHNPQRLYRFA